MEREIDLGWTLVGFAVMGLFILVLMILVRKENNEQAP